MTDPADIASQLSAAGFLVTFDGEIESAAAAYLLRLRPKTLKNWRNELRGPPWRVSHRIVLYKLDTVLAWRGTLETLPAPTADVKVRASSTTTRP